MIQSYAKYKFQFCIIFPFIIIGLTKFHRVNRDSDFRIKIRAQQDFKKILDMQIYKQMFMDSVLRHDGQKNVLTYDENDTLQISYML